MVTNANNNLHKIQIQISNHGFNDTLISQEINAKKKLEEILDKEESFWHKKSKVKWHIEGDRNTAFYHRLAKIKNSRNLITYMRNGDNIIIDSSEMANHEMQYFTNNLCFVGNNQITNHIMEVILNMVDENMNNMLTMLPYNEEISKEVFNLKNNNAPGPNGLGGFFYQTYWKIIENDVYKAILQFCKYGWIIPNYNANTIILIPKSKEANAMDQLTPIALANLKLKLSQRSLLID